MLDFEERQIVWEFQTPHQIGDKAAFLNDMLRIDPDTLDASFTTAVSDTRGG